MRQSEQNEMYQHLTLPTVEDVLNEVEKKHALHGDVTIRPIEIYCTTFGDYTRDITGQPTEFTRPALTQLLNRKKVPIAFYDRCSNGLKKVIFDEHVRRGNDLLLRMVKDNPDQMPANTTKVRAVLSATYTTIDDHFLLPIVLAELENMDNVTIRSFSYDPYSTELLIWFTDTECRYKNTDIVAGLRVSNSETGHAAVWLEPVVSTTMCSFANRNTLRNQHVDLKVIHKGSIDSHRIRKMTTQAKEIAQVGVVQYVASMEEQVKASHAIAYAKGIDALPKRMTDILEEEWSREEDLAKAEVAQRIVALAKELPLFRQAAIQQKAGQFLGLFNSYKSRITDIMEEINE